MLSTSNPQNKEQFTMRRHFGMITLLVLLLIVAFTANIIVGINMFSRTTREYREEILTRAAKLAAGQIDGDRISQWLDTGADTAYNETSSLLQNICTNMPYVQYLYVYQIKSDGCHVVFDFETTAPELDQYDEIPEVLPNKLGDVVEFDKGFSDSVPAMLEGGQIDIRENRGSYGWLLTKYEPIFNSAGKCVAYVGVDISMIGVKMDNQNFAKRIVIISTTLLILIAVIGILIYLRSCKADEYDVFEHSRKEQQLLFEQTAEALAGAIDAKDTYTNGHSRRVAEYSLKIAREAGKSREECEKIYFAALLHDVGKIGVPIEILSKKGRLTDEEFEQVKKHPVVGGQILSSIKQSPWLSIGARYHHERFNGRGYPEGLKGDDIPEIARIIAVADAYDAMTSNRSYRNAIPQHIVREELIKGIGTQFDPEFSRIMIQLLDHDPEYNMQETEYGTNMAPRSMMRCERLYQECTGGIDITRKKVSIRLSAHPDEGYSREESQPTLIIFDSLDGVVHPGEENNESLLYSEYARIRLDGQIVKGDIRRAEVRHCDRDARVEEIGIGKPEHWRHYMVEAVRNRDHALIRISDETSTREVILALPDAARFTYLSLGGEHCILRNILVEREETETEPEAIPRIAEEISHIKGCPEGDVPNLEVDGWRSHASEGIPIQDGLTLTFHSKSLPTARMVWHCPFISVFSSDDGQMNGNNFREYILLRLDGENWESNEHVKNSVKVDHRPEFEGWKVWKSENKKGLDCLVKIRRNQNEITMQTENLGIAVTTETKILDDVKDVYIALTGDQCTITNIRISRGE